MFSVFHMSGIYLKIIPVSDFWNDYENMLIRNKYNNRAGKRLNNKYFFIR